MILQDFLFYFSDEPGLTRLTRNTDWAFSSTKSEKTKKSTFSANAFDSTKPRNLISFNTLTHPSPIFIILQNVVRFTSNEWYYNKKQQVIKKQSWVLAQFCKSKRYQIQKKRIHETTKISISPPHFFFSDRPPNQSRPQNNIIKIVAFVWKKFGFRIH